MIRGLYTAATAMVAGMLKQQTVANNLANVNTYGYKKDTALYESFPSLLIARMANSQAGKPEALLGSLGSGVSLQQPTLDMSQGAPEETNYALDVAINGDAFFVVQTPQGLRYTRDGRFSEDANGRLVTGAGYLVLGESGPISIHGQIPIISETGEVALNDQTVDRLRLARFANPQALVKTNDNLFIGGGAQAVAPGSVQIAQGYLETSNVNPASAMTEMMAVLRAYELSQRMVQIQDETLNKAINEVGRV
jgi:flagellar basal-body rod protein FlgG